MRAPASSTPSASSIGAADLTVKSGGGGGGSGGGSGGLDLSVKKPRGGSVAMETDAAPTDYSSGAGAEASEKSAAPEDLSSSSKDK